MQNQDIVKKVDKRIKKAVVNAFLTVENVMHKAILTATDRVKIRVQMAVRSIINSKRHGPSSLVETLIRRISPLIPGTLHSCLFPATQI